MTGSPQLSGGAQDKIRRLILFFAILNLADGLGDANGLIQQPLSYYLKSVYGWAPDRITQYLSALMIPWLVRPLYGLLSDFLPVFGYRRKSYLILANGLAAVAYFWLTGLNEPGEILIGLMLISLGMAVSSTVSGALTIESGKGGLSGVFLNQQWMWYSVAAAATALAGGWLSQVFAPDRAFHVSAFVVAFAPLVVMLGAWLLIDEPKSKVDLSTLKSDGMKLKKALSSRNFWVVAAFLFFYYLHPAFYTPLYYHMTDELHFRQDFIGFLHAVWYLGAIAGTVGYSWLAKRFDLTGLLKLGVVFATLGTLSYLGLHGSTSAILVNLFAGVVSSAATVASLTLAAEYCPEGSEGFTYSLWMSIGTLSSQVSSNLGSILYVHVFDSQLAPLLWAAALFTLTNLLCIGILRLAKKETTGSQDDGRSQS
jgi:MFS family permease